MRGKSNQTIALVLAVIAILAVGYMVMSPKLTASVVTAGGNTVAPSEVKCSDVQCNVIPTYSYSSVDSYSTTVFSGTTQIKANGNAPVTSLSNPQKCDKLQYWLNNGTSGFCEIATVEQVACGSQSVQSKCYQYTALTLTAKDTSNDAYLTNANQSSTTNITIGANGVGNVDLKVQTTAKKVAMPFGGCMAIDYPTTISSVTASYNGASLNPCPYVWTYTATTTGNAYRLFEIPAGFDKAGAGDIKQITLQFLAGSSDPSGGVNIALRPANYYTTNGGEFALGVEKDKNQDTTTTFATVGSRAFYIQ